MFLVDGVITSKYTSEKISQLWNIGRGAARSPWFFIIKFKSS